MTSDISIVIPALDEAKAIGGVIEDLRKVERSMDGVSFEIIVIDDGSQDATGDVAKAKGADNIIRHPYPGGYGQSLKKGILAAQHDTIITIDADGTYPACSIPDMLEVFARNNDMVVGLRSGKTYDGGPFKGPMRKVLRFLVEYTTGQRIPDVNSGLRVFSQKVMMRYLNRLCDTFSFSTSSTLAYLMNRHFIGYVDIEYGERIGVSKVRIFRDSLRTLQYIVEAMAYYNPLKLFLLIFSVLLISAISLLAISLISGYAVIGYFAAGAFFTSIIAMLAGIFSIVIKGPSVPLGEDQR